MADIQKITWENYRAEIELMCIKTRAMKKELLKRARHSSWWGMAIGYPSKILLTITAAGGGIQILGEKTDELWITLTRTILEILVLIIVTTRDFFNFEKKAEKCYTAAKAMNAFYEIIKFQSFQIKGTEGDRMEVLKGLKEMYSEIVANNEIVQTVETTSSPPTPHQMESYNSSEDDEFTDDNDTMMTAKNSPRRMSKMVLDKDTQQATNDRNRMYYLHKMIEGM
jgi:hypothetical protein